LINHACVVESDDLDRQIGGRVELGGVVREVEALAVCLNSAAADRRAEEVFMLDRYVDRYVGIA
jgi:hypothetical protein